METAVSTLVLLPNTSNQIETFANSLISEIVNGNISAIETDYRLKAIENVIDKVRKNKEVKEAISNECDNYGKKQFNFGDATISLSSRSNYNYSKCAKWNELKGIEKDITEKRKKLETLMQSISNEIADVETGEMIQPAELLDSTKIISYKFIKSNL